MVKVLRFVILLPLFSVICQTVKAGDNISICNAIDTARSGVSRYWALYNAHCEALKSGSVVDYSHINNIDIEIPSDAKSIPLSAETDFHNVRLTILNNKKNNFYLFDMINEDTALIVNKKDVDRGDFKKYPNLRSNLVLLILKDKTPWVKNRKGYKYGHIRKDILLIDGGKAMNITKTKISMITSSISICPAATALSRINFGKATAHSRKTIAPISITMDIESINIAIFQICLVDIVISKDTPVGMAT